MGPSFKRLYFHPVSTSTSLESTEWEGICVCVVIGAFLAAAMEYKSCARPSQWSNGVNGPSVNFCQSCSVNDNDTPGTPLKEKDKQKMRKSRMAEPDR